MKVLFLHSFGELGDWNNRIKRQIELMKKKVRVEVYSAYYTQELYGKKDAIIKEIKEKDFDIIYAVGWLMCDIALEVTDKVIFDAGSHKSLNALYEQIGLDKDEALQDKDLEYKLKTGMFGFIYEKEKICFNKAKEVICWKDDEELIEKIYGRKVKPISMHFSKLPRSIPFEKKDDRVIAIAAKWGRKHKNYGLVVDIKNALKDKQVEFIEVGKGSSISYKKHSKLMDILNHSKVMFAPYLTGGNGTICEGINLGCNVVMGQWNPIRNYVHQEMRVCKGQVNRVSESLNCIKKALKKYYPNPKLPSESVQINKIIKLCKKTKG